ncbi:hypothetical protein DVH24_037171 [Malus domestica]|uniref:Uncharacterized protein n=1 Tax=Malus domestica TaxID=3750 RepID=A0A498HJ22_MALDO|nr:hypothetical protein DVH24_037171 [Malus domestica]
MSEDYGCAYGPFSADSVISDDRWGAFGTGRDGTGRDRTERRRGTNPFQGEVERKNTQNLSRGTARSIHFWRTKRGTERLVPFRPVPSHVPNAP